MATYTEVENGLIQVTPDGLLEAVKLAWIAWRQPKKLAILMKPDSEWWEKEKEKQNAERLRVSR